MIAKKFCVGGSDVRVANKGRPLIITIQGIHQEHATEISLGLVYGDINYKAILYDTQWQGLCYPLITDLFKLVVLHSFEERHPYHRSE